MEQKSFTKSGFFKKTSVVYDENEIKLIEKKFLRKKKEKTIGINENTIFFSSKTKISKSPLLYVSHVSRYDQLPTNVEEMASDDTDDLTMQMLSDGNDLAEFNGSAVQEEKETDFDEDLHLRTDTIELPAGRYIADIYNILQNSSAKEAQCFNVGGSFSLSKECLAYNEEWAFHTTRSLCGKVEIDSTPIKYMAFFLNTRKLFGKGGLYCGYHRQIIIGKLPSDTRNNFYNWCKERAPRLSMEGKEFTSSRLSLKPSAWFYPDHLNLTEEALVFTRKTMFKDEMAYVPYKRINMFLHSGMFRKTLEFYGEQNIVPKNKFSRSAFSEIVRVLESHGVKRSGGKTYKCSKLKRNNWFGRSPRLMFIDDMVYYSPKRLKNIGDADDTKIESIALNLKDIVEVKWYKPMFRPTGTLVITGEPKNIRLDQSRHCYSLVMPHVLTFKYRFFILFTGSLYKRLSAASGSRKRRYKSYPID